MQDEQVQRIESRFDGVDSRFDGVDSRLAGVESRLDVLDGRVGRIESKVDALDGRVDGIDSKIEVLDGRVEQLAQDLRQEMHEMGQDLRNRLDEGQRYMHVLHEELVERITALAPDFGPIRREVRGEIAELRESTDRRLVPLEAAERLRRKPKS